MVVISIIAILSVVGLVVFQNAQKSAKDAKIKADLNAIKKAYETNYDPTANGGQGGYRKLRTTDFAGNQISGPYTYAYGPDAVSPKDDGYKISATLSDGTPTSVISTQGTLAGTGGGNVLSACEGSFASNLLNYYQMETIAGGTTADSKGGTAATVVNATTSPGIVGRAASFNGSAYIKVTPSSPSSFTVSMWIKSAGNGFTFLWEGAGTSAPSIEGSDGNYQFYMSNQTNPLNTGSISSGSSWYLITATYDASSKTKSLYVNDQSKGSNTNVNSNNLNPLYIGHRAGSVYFYKGLIDEVAIFNRALSGSEISRIYNSGQGCSIL